jgi:hypothetical protein
MPQLYAYVGPKAIADRLSNAAAGTPIESVDDLLRWTRQARLASIGSYTITATFVIDESGILRVADRRSEHYACAGGKPVQSAGEMTFCISKGSAEVTCVTNQSTGYCPEPESWPSVREALERAKIAAPFDFLQKMIFRRCDCCGSINIVKDSTYICDVCSASLPRDWNLSRDADHLIVGEPK